MHKFPLEIRRITPHNKPHPALKRKEAQIRSAAFPTHQPFLVGQFFVQDVQDVAEGGDVVGAGDGVGVQEGPVEDLLEGGAVGGGLEGDPLGHVVGFWGGGEGEVVGGVVLGEDVGCYGAGLGGEGGG